MNLLDSENCNVAVLTPFPQKCVATLKTLTSLNKEVRPFFQAMIAFGDVPLFLPLAITVFGGPEGYLSVAIIAFGAFQFIAPKYYYRFGKWNLRSQPSLFKEVTVFKGTPDLSRSCGSPRCGGRLCWHQFLFFERGKETPRKKTKILYILAELQKNLEREGGSTQESKELPWKAKSKDIQKGKE